MSVLIIALIASLDGGTPLPEPAQPSSLDAEVISILDLLENIEQLADYELAQAFDTDRR